MTWYGRSVYQKHFNINVRYKVLETGELIDQVFFHEHSRLEEQQRKGGDNFFKFSLTFPSTSQTLRH